MKRKKYIYFVIIIFILALINTYITIRNKYTNNTIKNELVSLNKENIDLKIDLDITKKNRNYESNFNGKELDKDLIVYDINNNKIKLGDIVNENKLILRYSNLNCNTCIEEQIKNINKYQDSIGIQKIILLTTYQNTVYMDRFRKINKVKIKIYNLGEMLDKEINDIGFPYFFVLEENTMRINCTFIPQKDKNDLTNSYIENIQKKYFISN